MDAPSPRRTVHAIGSRVEGVGAWVDAFQQRHSVVGFPWAVFKKFSDDSASRMAANISYYTFFSLFPLMLVFVTVVGTVLKNDPELRNQVLDQTLGNVPRLREQVDSAIANLPDAGLPLAIGVVAALFTGLAAMNAAQFAFNQIWAVPWRQRPGYFPRNGRALAMTLIGGVALFAFGAVSGWIGSQTDAPWLHSALLMLLSGTLVLGSVLLAYRLLSRRRLTLRQILPGSLLFTVIVTPLVPYAGRVFGLYVQRASAAYGVLASVIALLTLFYLLGQLFMLTAELNTVLAWRLWPRGLFPDRLSRADRETYALLAQVEERMPEERVVAWFGVHDDDRVDATGTNPPESVFRFVDADPVTRPYDVQVRPWPAGQDAVGDGGPAATP